MSSSKQNRDGDRLPDGTQLARLWSELLELRRQVDDAEKRRIDNMSIKRRSDVDSN